MSFLQKRVLWAALWLNLIINGACLTACLWSDYQLEKQGVSIEQMIAGKK